MFTIVFEQVLVLFILICLGILLSGFKLLNEATVKGMTDLILYAVTPAVIIKSFIRERNAETLKLLILGFIASIVIFSGYVIISSLLFKKAPVEERSVLRFGIVFSNCGFMSLPLLQAIVGSDGILVGASFIAAFNIFTWTYGIFIMSGNGKSMSLKKVLLNPGIIGIIIGFIVFCCSIKLPNVILSPISYIAALNTPIPMLVIGYNIYKTDLFSAFKNFRCIIATAIRLVIYPLATIFALRCCGIQGDLMVSLAICSAAPTAATTTMLAVKFGKAADASVKLVALTTLFSLLTMPIIIALALKL